MTTVFEVLPDEILLFVCEYLTRYDIIRAFCGLNHRLSCTISEYTRSLTFANESGNQLKQCRKILPIVGPYLQSLTINRTSLTLEELSLAKNIEELTFIYTPVHSIPRLHNLTDLNIISGQSFSLNDIFFVNENNLHSVYINCAFPLTFRLSSPTKFANIKQLAINLQSPEDFINLLRLCPELTCLYLTLQNYTSENEISNDTSSNLRIFSFRTTYQRDISFENFKILLKSLSSNLEHLSLEIDTRDQTFLDGQILENYLKETFPQLKLIEFMILFRYGDRTKDTPIIRIRDVLTTFQNLYWSTIAPQTINGYYNRIFYEDSICIHTESIPTVQRRRYFLY